jgi:hypothetical protein
MYSTPTLATRFARNTRVLRADVPLTEDQMRTAAPSVFAESKHASRSERYTYIPTIEVLRGLRKEGFEPFMVAQGASRIEGKAAQNSVGADSVVGNCPTTVPWTANESARLRGHFEVSWLPDLGSNQGPTD